MNSADHHGCDQATVACAVITVSDTRTIQTDSAGRLIREMLSASGHRVVSHDIVPDEPSQISDLISETCQGRSCSAVLVTGGTGLAARDSTIEAVEPLLDKRLCGFGELFRMLSYSEVGAAAMLSRATAGVCRGVVVFCLPGSPKAVKLAMERLILPQLSHIAGLIRPVPPSV